MFVAVTDGVKDPSHSKDKTHHCPICTKEHEYLVVSKLVEGARCSSCFETYKRQVAMPTVSDSLYEPSSSSSPHQCSMFSIQMATSALDTSSHHSNGFTATALFTPSPAVNSNGKTVRLNGVKVEGREGENGQGQQRNGADSSPAKLNGIRAASPVISDKLQKHVNGGGNGKEWGGPTMVVKTQSY